MLGLIAAGVVVVGLILWAALVEPPWLLPNTQGLSPADRVKAQTDLRNTLVTMLGGLAVLVGGAAAAVNVVLTQRVQWRAQVTERFSKAIEQLGQRGDDRLDVRMGAVYALEQIARDSAELHWPIMEVLTAYLREHTGMRPTNGEAAPDTLASYTPADLEAMATVIGRRRRVQDPEGQTLNLRQVDLRHVRWSNAHLERAYLAAANLEGAVIENAHLEGAFLRWANLKGAKLSGANLRGAYLLEAQLSKADLEFANLKGANLDSANLRGADLTQVDMENATLIGAHLEGSETILSDTNLRMAVLRGAHMQRVSLEWANLQGAILDSANLEKASFVEVNLEGAHLQGTNFKDVDLTEARGLIWGQLRLARNVNRDLLPPSVRAEADREAGASRRAEPEC